MPRKPALERFVCLMSVKRDGRYFEPKAEIVLSDPVEIERLVGLNAIRPLEPWEVAQPATEEPAS